jgi:hypothetical protein
MVGRDGPCHARQFVGQGARHHIRVATREHGADPLRQLSALALQSLHVGTRALHQQAPQILVAALADAQQLVFTTGTVLAWHQPDGGGEVTAAAVVLAVTDFGGQHAGGDRSDTRYRHEPLAQIIFSDLPGQGLLDLGDLLVEVLEMGMQSLQHLYQPCWQALFCQHGRQALDRGVADGQADTELQQKAVDLVARLDTLAYQRTRCSAESVC